jgi:hypothetical protein
MDKRHNPAEVSPTFGQVFDSAFGATEAMDAVIKSRDTAQRHVHEMLTALAELLGLDVWRCDHVGLLRLIREKSERETPEACWDEGMAEAAALQERAADQVEASRRNSPRGRCPYQEGTPEYRWWVRGFEHQNYWTIAGRPSSAELG